ncbi:MAG: NusG domain II-containing protein [Clostridia bacterium]|nr:NusG domain II-containing protein [Clostridia bacterium]
MDKSVRIRVTRDIILISVLLLLSIGAFVLINAMGDDGTLVEVTVDGETVASYKITETLETEIVTPYGKNVLVIKNGQAEVTSADCPDGICASHRPISKIGESIVCLPHKLVVSVTDGEG